MTTPFIPVTIVNALSTYETDAEVHPDTEIREMVMKALNEESPWMDPDEIHGISVFDRNTGGRINPDMTISEAGVGPGSIIEYDVKMMQ